MPDEARDGRNVALKFSSDCWPDQLSKTEFLHQNFSMPNIFHDSKVGLVERPWNVEANHRESVIMS